MIATIAHPQVRLRGEYASRWPALLDALATIPKSRQLSRPHLLDLAAHRYADATTKLFILGQQTFGWVNDLSDERLASEGVNWLCRVYGDFALGRDYYATPFWTAAHAIYAGLNPEGPESGFVWTNVLKIDESGERPGKDVERLLFATFHVLPVELELARPDAVVCLTGPSYDDLLRRMLPGIEFVGVPGFVARELALLRHPALPAASYRTYHPKYLRLSQRWGIIERLPSLILSNVHR